MAAKAGKRIVVPESALTRSRELALETVKTLKRISAITNSAELYNITTALRELSDKWASVHSELHPSAKKRTNREIDS